MDAVLCRVSAYEILNRLRTVAPDGRPLPVDPSARMKPVALKRTRATRLGAGTPPMGDVRLLLDSTAGLTAPVHVLVEKGTPRRYTDLRIPHCVSGPLVPGSLVTVADGLRVSSPEHLFLQMARSFDELELIWFGCELCATYARSPRRDGQLERALPLTTKSDLAAYLEKARAAHAPGAAAATGALRFVLEGAASPREIALPLAMCLPYAKGGRAIPQPCLNYRVEVDRRLATIHNRSHFSCDCCWPERRLVVEYDSDAHHLDARQAAQDNDRSAALEQMGFRVIAVSSEQFKRLVLSDDAFKRVATCLGVKMRENRGYDWQERRWDLRKRLLRLSDEGLNWSD